MASAEDLLRLRSLINDTDAPFQFTDDQLTAMLLGVEGDFNRAAAEGWSLKAARFSALVNTSESGSSRSLGDLYQNALNMRKVFLENAASVEPPISTRTRIGRIVRPPSERRW